MWIQAGTMPSANVSVRSLAEEEKYLSGQTVSAPLFCSSAVLHAQYSTQYSSMRWCFPIPGVNPTAAASTYRNSSTLIWMT
jgi:hypothetical protein